MVTVEKLKELVQEFMRLEQDEYENSTEWAYVALEPDLIRSHDVTLAYLKQIDSKEEFVSLGENSFLEEILDHFQSAAIYGAIEEQYAKFFGTAKETPFYKEFIEGLDKIVKNK